MSWKRTLQLRDLGPPDHLELLCKACGHVRKVYPGHPAQDSHGHLYMDEVEARARCGRKGCKGDIALAMGSDGDTHSFQAGIA